MIYFRIKFLAPNEFDTEEQVSFMRTYIEEVCKLTDYGFEFGTFIERKFKNGKTIVLVGYKVKEGTKQELLDSVFSNLDLSDELLIYFSL